MTLRTSFLLWTVIALSIVGACCLMVCAKQRAIDPHANMMRGCMQESTDAPQGSEAYEVTRLACEAQVYAREQQKRTVQP